MTDPDDKDAREYVKRVTGSSPTPGFLRIQGVGLGLQLAYAPLLTGSEESAEKFWEAVTSELTRRFRERQHNIEWTDELVSIVLRHLAVSAIAGRASGGEWRRPDALAAIAKALSAFGCHSTSLRERENALDGIMAHGALARASSGEALLFTRGELADYYASLFLGTNLELPWAALDALPKDYAHNDWANAIHLVCEARGYGPVCGTIRSGLGHTEAAGRVALTTAVHVARTALNEETFAALLDLVDVWAQSPSPESEWVVDTASEAVRRGCGEPALRTQALERWCRHVNDEPSEWHCSWIALVGAAAGAEPVQTWLEKQQSAQDSPWRSSAFLAAQRSHVLSPALLETLRAEATDKTSRIRLTAVHITLDALQSPKRRAKLLKGLAEGNDPVAVAMATTTMCRPRDSRVYQTPDWLTSVDTTNPAVVRWWLSLLNFHAARYPAELWPHIERLLSSANAQPWSASMRSRIAEVYPVLDGGAAQVGPDSSGDAIDRFRAVWASLAERVPPPWMGVLDCPLVYLEDESTAQLPMLFAETSDEFRMEFAECARKELESGESGRAWSARLCFLGAFEPAISNMWLKLADGCKGPRLQRMAMLGLSCGGERQPHIAELGFRCQAAEVRWESLRYAYYACGREALPMIRDAARDRDPLVRRQAYRELYEFADEPEALELVRGAVGGTQGPGEDNPYVLTRAIGVIGVIGTRDDLEALERLKNDGRLTREGRVCDCAEAAAALLRARTNDA